MLTRWLRFFAIILWRAKGFGNRWTALRCIVHTVWASAGLPNRSRVYRLNLDGVLFHVEADRGDIAPYGSVWINQEHRLDERFVPSEGTTIIDAGAQVGFFTVLMARMIGQGTIYALEPEPGSFARLVKNVRANQLTNVRAFRSALGLEEGTAYLECRPHSVDNRLTSGPAGGTIEVACTTLDRFVAAQGIECIDLLKIDTEGSELEILRSGQEVALPRVQAAVVEIHGRALVEPIDEIMRACGLEQVYPTRNLLHFYLRRRLT